jgi:hypothetical protein
MENEVQQQKQKDLLFNWVHTSSFLFYIQVFCILAFILGGCYRLYQHSYQGTPEVAVPENTMYTPKYK